MNIRYFHYLFSNAITTSEPFCSCMKQTANGKTLEVAAAAVSQSVSFNCNSAAAASLDGFTPWVKSSRCAAPHWVSRDEPDTCRRLDLRQVDCHLAALSLMCDGLCVDQVRGSADGQLLLQSSSDVAPACQQKRVVRVWLQLRDQLSLLLPCHLHAPLVIQDLWAHTGSQVRCSKKTKKTGNWFILHGGVTIVAVAVVHTKAKAQGSS